MQTIASIVAAYIIGSINFSMILLKILGRGDPREKFSGNAGTTNAYRQTGLFWAAAVLVLESGKAAGMAFFSLNLLELSYAPWFGLALVLGNRYPCFHNFRGGKGVANYLGFSVVLAPISTALGAFVWVFVHTIVRIPFIASFFMILTLAIGTLIEFHDHPLALTGTAATVLLIFHNHKVNIIKLIEERRKNKISAQRQD